MSATKGEAQPARMIPRPSLGLKFSYGAGSMANGAFGAIGGLAMFYYNQVVGVPATLVGLAISLVVFIDGFWDPLIGHGSDQLRTRFGRRHPVFMTGLFILPLAIYLRWHPPSGWQPDAMFWYILGTGLFVNLAWSLYEIPTGALAAELAPDYHDRTLLLGYRWALGTLGAGIATLLVYGVFLRATPDHPVGQLNGAGYGPLSLSIIALILLSGLTLTLGTWSAIPRLYKPVEEKTRPLKDQFSMAFSTLKNRNFLVAMSAGLISGLSAGINGGLGLYFQTFLWELKSSDILVLTLLGVPMPILAGIIAPLLSRRWGKRGTMMSLFVASVIIGQTPMLLKLLGILDLRGSPWLLIVLGSFSLVSGICSIGGYIIVSSMITDIVEDVQVKTGTRAEGLIATADSIPSKIVTAASALIPALLLGFVAFPNQAKPGPEALELITRVAWIYLPLISLIYLASIGVWSFYRLEKSDHDRNLEHLGL